MNRKTKELLNEVSINIEDLYEIGLDLHQMIEEEFFGKTETFLDLVSKNEDYATLTHSLSKVLDNSFFEENRHGNKTGNI